MLEQAEQIYQLIMLYAPMVLSVVTVLVNFIVLFKKIKDINVKEEVNNALIDTDTQIKELVTQTQMVIQENQALRKKQNQLIEALTQIEVKDDDTVHKEM